MSRSESSIASSRPRSTNLSPNFSHGRSNSKAVCKFGTVTLWIVFLYVGLYATPPVTPEAQAHYLQLANDATEMYGKEIMEASIVEETAQSFADDMKVWFWKFKSEDYVAEVRRRQALADELHRYSVQLRNAHNELIAEAKDVVGIFSPYAVDEARDRFWRGVHGGNEFAKRLTFWQMVFNFGRTSGTPGEDNDVSIMGWLVQFIVNITIGLIGALFGFAASLPAIIQSYHPEFLSALTFYMLALGGAISVVIGIIAAMVGCLVGGVVAFIGVLKLCVCVLSIGGNLRLQRRTRYQGLPLRNY